MIRECRTHWARVRIVLFQGLALVLLASLWGMSAAHAQLRPHRRQVAPPAPMTPGLAGKNALGGLLGPWFSKELAKEIVGPDYRIAASATAFHLELFYQPRLTGVVNLDLNVGAIGRGDIRISNGIEDTYGTATLYPIGFGVRIAPLAQHATWTVQPMLRVGGSLVIGTERFQSVVNTNIGTLIGQSMQSRVAPGFYGGAGLIWLLGNRLALTGNAKYQQVKFSKELFGSKDYSGLQVLIGVMYLYL